MDLRQISHNKKMQKFTIISFVLLFNIWLVGCENVIIEPSLKKAIYTYYEFEKADNWNQTYSLRNIGFRRVVPLKFYIEQMTLDNKGWKLLSYEIISAETKDDDNYVIKIKFEEQTPPGYTFDEIKAKKIEVTQNTKWTRKNGIWYCQDAGSRGHLTQNHDLTPKTPDPFRE